MRDEDAGGGDGNDGDGDDDGDVDDNGDDDSDGDSEFRDPSECQVHLLIVLISDYQKMATAGIWS